VDVKPSRIAIGASWDRIASRSQIPAFIMTKLLTRATFLTAIAVLWALLAAPAPPARVFAKAQEQRLLYVAAPGIRNYLEHGGHGVLVFDIDRNHRFVKRIPFGGTDEKGSPRNVKGLCAHAAPRANA